MITQKEYFLLSILAYFNFTEMESGINLLEVLKKIPIHKYHNSQFKMLSQINSPLFVKYFENELSSWKIFSIENRRATREEKGGKRTGFYGISFEKNNEYVIAFRGSELTPYEEAYKDFIETNLLISMGKRPEQFNDAVDFFNKHIYLFGIDKNSISVTGHSLGGGIAQYLAAYCKFSWDYIPFTYTWNSVGLKSLQIFSINDFINFEDIVKKIDRPLEVKSCLLGIKDDFFKYFQESLLNEDESKNKETNIIKIVENYKNSGLKLELNIRYILGKVRVPLNEVGIIKDNTLNCFLEIEELSKALKKAKLFFQSLKNNSEYENFIINYGHSKDITFNLYKHIGVSYDIDRYLKRSENRKLSDLISVKENIFLKFHLEDVFLPYFYKENSECYSFGKTISLDYIASFLRFYIYKEVGFSKGILKLFYTIKSDELDYLFIKKELIEGIDKSKIEIIYKQNIIKLLAEMKDSEIIKVWDRTRDKMSSPFEFIDVYDIFLY